ncbi:MAG: hypothetical protein N3F05_03590 [Candidatus Diapherotrites archaeon]|nr:hypothetical protein [Candidatus Diapherotrites archaeon]
MNHSIKVGFSFGLTSAVITTLGLMMGLYASTESKAVVISGVLLIATADALSDSLGIHLSEEAESKHTKKEVWQSTFSTFIFKFLFACVFVLPLLIFDLYLAVIVNIILGFFMLGIFSYAIASEQNIKRILVVIEHFAVAILVLILTYLIGHFINCWVESKPNI